MVRVGPGTQGCSSQWDGEVAQWFLACWAGMHPRCCCHAR